MKNSQNEELTPGQVLDFNSAVLTTFDVIKQNLRSLGYTGATLEITAADIHRRVVELGRAPLTATEVFAVRSNGRP